MSDKMNRIYTGKLISILFISMTILLSLIVSSHTAPSSEIIVYGNDKCGYCKETIKWLEHQNIPFIYRDVETYETNQEEMFSKLKKGGFTSAALFPVLDVNGQILMKPKFDDIKKAIDGRKIDDRREKKIRKPQWRPEKLKSLKSDFNSVKNKLSESDIIFYDDGSGSGKTVLKQLIKEKIPFKIKQLNKLGNAAYFDMISRLSALGYENTILFPVIEVRGEMIMKPSIDEVKTLIIEMTAE